MISGDIPTGIPDLRGTTIRQTNERLTEAIQRVLAECTTGTQTSRFNSGP